MPTSSEILQVILEYIYTDESHTIKGSFCVFVVVVVPTYYNLLRFVAGFSPNKIVLRGRFVLALSCTTESLNVEFVCNVLVVADQLLITRLKEMCEVVITENCMQHLSF